MKNKKVIQLFSGQYPLISNPRISFRTLEIKIVNTETADIYSIIIYSVQSKNRRFRKWWKWIENEIPEVFTKYKWDGESEPLCEWKTITLEDVSYYVKPRLRPEEFSTVWERLKTLYM
ncbi:MAG: hypothetical protein J6I84_03410 [Bacilli bacterium]|nr:hypothetical protein [Bacilli bacterium]